MPRTGENIYKRKDGRWEGRYIKGHKSNKTCYGYIYGKTYTEVKRRLLKTHMDEEEKQAVIHVLKDNKTFAHLAEEWFADSCTLFKESTCVKYHNLLSSYIIPELGSYQACEITDEVISAFVNHLLTEGGTKGCGLQPKTVSDILSILRNIRKYAVRRNMDVNYLSCSMPVKYKPKQSRVLSVQEQQKLCGYLSENRSLRNMGLKLCLFTGLRVGEICALKWRDISLEEQTLYVHQTMQRLGAIEKDMKNDNSIKTHILISDPKSSCSVRIVPLPELLIGELQSFRQPSDTFFLTGEKASYIEPRTMQNHFKSVLKACHIDDANFHALRHTFATRCIESGFDIKSLSEILGHANVNITLNRYVHPTMKLKRENMNRLSKMFETDSPSKSPSDME